MPDIVCIHLCINYRANINNGVIARVGSVVLGSIVIIRVGSVVLGNFTFHFLCESLLLVMTFSIEIFEANSHWQPGL